MSLVDLERSFSFYGLAFMTNDLFLSLLFRDVLSLNSSRFLRNNTTTQSFSASAVFNVNLIFMTNSAIDKLASISLTQNQRSQFTQNCINLKRSTNNFSPFREKTAINISTAFGYPRKIILEMFY